MRGDADEEVRAEGAAHDPRVERARGQLDAVAGGGARDVGAVVDEEVRPRAAREECGARGQLVERARAQVFLAQLDERDARGDGPPDEREQGQEV